MSEWIWPSLGDDVKAYKAKRFVVTTEKSMRMFNADEHIVALLNLAVPSPIFSETEPILCTATASVNSVSEGWAWGFKKRDLCSGASWDFYFYF